MGSETTEQEFIDYIRYLVWSGFYSKSEIAKKVDKELALPAGGRVDPLLIREEVQRQLGFKEGAEKQWPEVTDCDRLEEAFQNLNEDGIVALHHASFTIADGLEDAIAAMVANPDDYHGYCFYHGQDVERAIEGKPLYLSFGSGTFKDEESIAVAESVLQHLRAVGLTATWQGTLTKRIELPGFSWQRRYRDQG